MRRREKWADSLLEDRVTDNFPNLGKETHIQVQEKQSPKQDEDKQVHTKTYYKAPKI